MREETRCARQSSEDSEAFFQDFTFGVKGEEEEVGKTPTSRHWLSSRKISLHFVCAVHIGVSGILYESEK